MMDEIQDTIDSTKLWPRKLFYEVRQVDNEWVARCYAFPNAPVLALACGHTEDVARKRFAPMIAALEEDGVRVILPNSQEVYRTDGE